MDRAAPPTTTALPEHSVSIVDAFLARCKREPDAIFLRILEDGHWRDITTFKLFCRAAQWARLLEAHDCRSGDIVIIALQHDLDQYAAFLGCLLLGAVPSYLPLRTAKQDVGVYQRECRTQLSRVSARAFVTVPNGPDDLGIDEKEMPCECLTAQQLRAFDPDFSPTPSRGEAAAFLQHSSGTTSSRKGILLSHRAVASHVNAYSETIGIKRGQYLASWLPLYHDMGLIATFMIPLIRDCSVVVMDAFSWLRSPRAFLQAIEQAKAKWIWMPNFAFQYMSRFANKCEGIRLDHVNAFFNGSEPCRAESMDRFCSSFAPNGVRPDQLSPIYGMAESVLITTQSTIGQAPRRLDVDRNAFEAGQVRVSAERDRKLTLLSVGKPLKDLSLKIIDADGCTMPNGSIGEIAIQAPWLFSGYFHAEAESRDAFVEGWFRTGDLGFLLDEELYVTGRIKDLVIVRGRNFYAHDIEAIVSSVTGVRPGRVAAVGAYNRRDGSDDLVVICEISAGLAEDEEFIQRQISKIIEQALGYSGAIVRIVPPGWLIKTSSGKMSRRENLAKYLSENPLPCHV